MFLSKEHAGDDEEAAEEEPEGDVLGEQPPGKDDGGDGVEIDPVGGGNGTKLADDPVPKEEAQHGGYHAEEQQVPQHIRTQDDLKGGEAWIKQIIRDDGEEAIEKNLAGDEQGAVALQHGLHQQGIDGPAETGTEGQQVAKG